MSRREARKRANGMFEAYKCRYCDFWHYGKDNDANGRHKEVHPVLGKIVRVTHR